MGSCFEKQITYNNFTYPTLSIIDKVHMNFIHPCHKLELFINKLCQENSIVIHEHSKKYINDIINIKNLFNNINIDILHEILLEFEQDRIKACLHVICLWYVLFYRNIVCEPKDIYIKYTKTYECNITYLKTNQIKLSLECNYLEY